MAIQLKVSSPSQAALVDITAQVQAAVRQSGVTAGICYVYVPHTTAGVLINESADPNVGRDILAQLGRLVPQQGDYRHAEGNAPAHIKASLVGTFQAIPVENGRLALGTWQGIFLCEFDGPRQRTVVVQVQGDRQG